MSSLADLTAAGPGDVKRPGRGANPPAPKRRNTLNVSPPPPRFRYVELNGRTIWRPAAPGWPDAPGGIA